MSLDLSAAELTSIQALAVEACMTAGRFIIDSWHQGTFYADSISRNDIKLSTDRNAEAIIKEIILRDRPHDGIIAEESGVDNHLAKGVWIIDPLDGTVNFAHGYQRFCTTVAWAYNHQVCVAAIYDPSNDEIFTAIKGQGAFCNGKKITVSDTASFDIALFATGFGNKPTEDPNLNKFKAIKNMVQRVRIGGSSTLDLAYIACGRLDAYYESNLYIWDVAAGQLIIEEAGGFCGLWTTETDFGRTCLATNNKLKSESLNLLNLNWEKIARTIFNDGAN